VVTVLNGTIQTFSTPIRVKSIDRTIVDIPQMVFCPLRYTATDSQMVRRNGVR
jgi:hypothetical protein